VNPIAHSTPNAAGLAWRRARPVDQAPARFHLFRFYTASTLLVVLAVLAAILFLQHKEEQFFQQAQRQQAEFFAQAQVQLARQNERAARDSLLALHEASHLNLTRLVANTMWETDFAPLVAAARSYSADACRALAPDGAGSVAIANARRACFAEIGQRIRALPGFRALDRKAYAAMRASTVFKIKVFDLRGVTVYSSEHPQIGEDASANLGWQSAAAGRAASELTHRDRFSAFEGVVENRDLISTYVPVRAGPAGEILGVFELYSDVTPFLEQMQSASKSFAANIASNEARVEQAASANQAMVRDSSTRFVLIVGGLIALLYAASLAIVQIGQRVIDRQRRAQEEAAARERLWHREKMAALSTLAANVSHEVGNPLTVISCIAQMLPDNDEKTTGDSTAVLAQRILDQTDRIAQMMRRISKFAEARSQAEEYVEINPMIEAVCEFQRFDHRYRRTPIEFVPGAQLPAPRLVPDHLNEAMMNLLQACADSGERQAAEHALRVSTEAADGEVRIDLTCLDPEAMATVMTRLATDRRFEAARRRVADMGGRIEVGDDRVRVALPADAAATD